MSILDDVNEQRYNINMKKYIQEAAGTALLILGGLAPIILGMQSVDLLGQALCFALVYMLSLYLFGMHGYFNPAVSIALAINNRLDRNSLPFYILSQIAGALLGGGILYAIVRSLGIARDQMGLFGANTFSPQVNSYTVIALEIIITCIFTYTILKLENTTESKLGKTGLIAIAFFIINIMSATITSTGANPARSIAMAFLSMPKYNALHNLPIFVVAPIAGALLAVYIPKIVHKLSR